MTLAIDLFWSFRSPYSYLAAGRLAALGETYDLDIAVRIVQPIAIRDPGFFERSNPLFGRYVMRDSQRMAEMHGIPFRWPVPDPVVMDMKTRAIAQEQPYIHRLSRLGVAAAEHGRGLAFIDQVSRLIWSGDADNWHQGDHLAGAATRAGLDLAELDAAIEAAAARYDAALAANANDLEAAGHWGVPTMVVDGEPFFGHDRIDAMIWRLRQRGLARR